MSVVERPWPVVGHAPWFVRDKLGCLERLAQADGPVAEVRLGRERVGLLTEPEDIRHVLVSNDRNYDKTERLTGGQALFGRGLLTSRGEAHRRQRLLLQPLFHMRVVARFESVVRETCERAVAGWPSPAELDLAAATGQVARRVMSVALAGPELGDDPAFVAAVEARQRYIAHLFVSLLPLRDRLPTRIRRDRIAGDRHLRAALSAAAEARAAEPADDLLSLLAAARYEDGSPLDPELLVDEALTLLVTGYETLGDALAWTLFLVATHPEVERGLLAEPDGDFLQGVIAESLRLYPPTWLYVRIAREPDTLPSGEPVGAGRKLYLSPWVVQRDPRLHPDPARFDPARSARGRPRHAYFPFGSGPHVCLGEALARMELGLAVGYLVPRLRIALAPGADPTPVPGITLKPRRLTVRVGRR